MSRTSAKSKSTAKVKSEIKNVIKIAIGEIKKKKQKKKKRKQRQPPFSQQQPQTTFPSTVGNFLHGSSPSPLYPYQIQLEELRSRDKKESQFQELGRQISGIERSLILSRTGLESDIANLRLEQLEREQERAKQISKITEGLKRRRGDEPPTIYFSPEAISVKPVIAPNIGGLTLGSLEELRQEQRLPPMLRGQGRWRRPSPQSSGEEESGTGEDQPPPRTLRQSATTPAPAPSPLVPTPTPRPSRPPPAKPVATAVVAPTPAPAPTTMPPPPPKAPTQEQQGESLSWRLAKGLGKGIGTLTLETAKLGGRAVVGAGSLAVSAMMAGKEGEQREGQQQQPLTPTFDLTRTPATTPRGSVEERSEVGTQSTKAPNDESVARGNLVSLVDQLERDNVATRNDINRILQSFDIKLEPEKKGSSLIGQIKKKKVSAIPIYETLVSSFVPERPEEPAPAPTPAPAPSPPKKDSPTFGPSAFMPPTATLLQESELSPQEGEPAPGGLLVWGDKPIKTVTRKPKVKKGSWFGWGGREEEEEVLPTPQPPLSTSIAQFDIPQEGFGSGGGEGITPTDVATANLVAQLSTEFGGKQASSPSSSSSSEESQESVKTRPDWTGGNLNDAEDLDEFDEMTGMMFNERGEKPDDIVKMRREQIKSANREELDFWKQYLDRWRDEAEEIRDKGNSINSTEKSWLKYWDGVERRIIEREREIRLEEARADADRKRKELARQKIQEQERRLTESALRELGGQASPPSSQQTPSSLGEIQSRDQLPDVFKKIRTRSGNVYTFGVLKGRIQNPRGLKGIDDERDIFGVITSLPEQEQLDYFNQSGDLLQQVWNSYRKEVGKEKFQTREERKREEKKKSKKK